jgi:hypothetical protein
VLDRQEALLLEALRPMAAALSRLEQATRGQQAIQHGEVTSLLMEVLDSLQPTAQEQLLPMLALPPGRSSHSSAA